MEDSTLTQKGKPCRIVNGHAMIIHRQAADGDWIWRCAKQRNGCQGRARSTGNAIVEISAHNHLSEPESVEKRRKVQVLKQSAAGNRATPSGSLAEEAQTGVDDNVLHVLPSHRALQQTVNRVRKVPNAKEADVQPDKMSIPAELKLTLRNERFLLVDSYDIDPDQPRFFAYVSDEGISLLRNNLDCAPRFFDSLLTVNVFKDASSLPAIYVILQDRKQVTYERIIQAIFDHPLLEGIVPDSIVSDFEYALISAVAKRWPSTNVHLCHFHFCQALFTNVQKKGLLSLYQKDQVKSLLRCFSCLAFLPRDSVEDGFNELCAAMTGLIPRIIPARFRTSLEEFFKYFRQTYVGSCCNNRHVRARFPMELWNCYERTLEGNPRTNCSIEDWHAHLNALFPRAHMPFSQWFVRIAKEEEKTRNLAARHAQVPAEHIRGRPSGMSIRENNLRVHVMNFDRTPVHRRNTLQYLHCIQVHLSPVAFSRLMEEQRTEEVVSAECSNTSTQGSLPSPSSTTTTSLACSSTFALHFNTPQSHHVAASTSSPNSSSSIGLPLSAFSFDSSDA